MKRSCIARITQPEYEEVYPELVKLIPDKSEIPGKISSSIIYNFSVPRKEIVDINFNEWPLEMAKVISSVIPKDSLEVLKQKAANGDKHALLSLADCKFFGFKGMVFKK